MADLLFILHGFSCFAYDEFSSALTVWSNSSQSNRGQRHSDTRPYSECSLSKDFKNGRGEGGLVVTMEAFIPIDQRSNPA